MTSNYEKIIHDNLDRIYTNLPQDLGLILPANQKGDSFFFEAFGEECRIQPEGIHLGGREETGVLGVLISLYMLNACPETSVLQPLKAFKDFPGSMPYVGAFASYTEKILVPYVHSIEEAQNRIMERMQGKDASEISGGDFSFLLCPLPKITLCYIFYRADDEFSASATCLFSNNAHQFLPLDALADVGEYTSRKIIQLLT
ncbi:MAG: DUF3786 domain-containing protein [Thermodesulfobacteriota bacterium]|nr:DUF3786 domain-containing protein [Thermodesulfobacteriota bacterium]